VLPREQVEVGVEQNQQQQVHGEGIERGVEPWFKEGRKTRREHDGRPVIRRADPAGQQDPEDQNQDQPYQASVEEKGEIGVVYAALVARGIKPLRHMLVEKNFFEGEAPPQDGVLQEVFDGPLPGKDSSRAGE